MVKITLGIDGMMCPMCEAHVNEALRAIAGVKKVSSSHKKGETVVIAEEEAAEEAFRETVGKAGYKVTAYRTEPCEKKGFFSSLFSKK